jgi:hypothetical protein
MALTHKDLEALGEIFDKKLESHVTVLSCPNGITPKTAEGIKALVELINNGQKSSTSQ